MSQGRDLKIIRQINFAEINWNRVHQVFSRRFKLDYDQTHKSIKKFINNFTRPLNLHWYKKSSPDLTDRRITSALCEIYACDKIVLKLDKKVRLVFINFTYSFVAELVPDVGNEGTDNSFLVCSKIAKTSFSILNFNFKIDTLGRAVLVQAILFCLALFFYVTIYGSILYLTSVLVLLSFSPYEVAFAALNRFEFAAVLLFGFVALSAAFGKAVRNLYLVFKQGGLKNVSTNT